MHRAGSDLLDADLAGVQVRDRPAHREDAPGGLGVIEDQVGQRRDRLHLELVRSQTVRVDAQVRVLQQTGEGADHRGGVGRTLDVLEMQVGVPAVGAPEERKDRVTRVLQISRQDVDLGVRLSRLVVAAHQTAGGQMPFGFDRIEQLAEDLDELLLRDAEEGVGQVAKAVGIHRGPVRSSGGERRMRRFVVPKRRPPE